MFNLTGKNALVTGGASGIGAATARTLAAAGAKVYVADIDFDRGIAVADAIVGEGFAAEFMELDVSDHASCRATAASVHKTDGKLDILVNNAGLGHVGTILETTAEDLHRLFAVNVGGMFDLTKAFIEHMIGRNSGVIVNLASIGGVVAIRERLAYCTTKFAVVKYRQFSRTQRWAVPVEPGHAFAAGQAVYVKVDDCSTQPVAAAGGRRR